MVSGSGGRQSFLWHWAGNDRAGNQCGLAGRLHVGMPFPAPFGRRLARRTGGRAAATKNLSLCELSEPPPHAVGLAQPVLGRIHRPLRPPVCDGSMDRLADFLKVTRVTPLHELHSPNGSCAHVQATHVTLVTM